jgi:hypothetical protein
VGRFKGQRPDVAVAEAIMQAVVKLGLLLVKRRNVANAPQASTKSLLWEENTFVVTKKNPSRRMLTVMG